jgi:phosphopantothenoylcysteine decarboxylase/phosphopantothenate--cysteine ligase
MPRLLITAGPTREPLDSVRFISNRSSGRLGIELAREAACRGHEVTLLLGPVSQATRADVPLGRVLRFETTCELESLLETAFPACDLLIMAAAVCDHRLRGGPAAGKLAREGERGLTLDLEPTPDLVARCALRRRPGQRIIAFALEEPDRLEVNARRKLRDKGVDALVANPLETMEAPRVRATLYHADGRVEPAPEMDKSAFAAWLLDRVA